MAKFPDIAVNQSRIDYALRLMNSSEQICHFIHQQESDAKNQGHSGVVIVGLNNGGKEMVETIEELCNTGSETYCFSLLSITRSQHNQYHTEVHSSLGHALGDKLVIIVDSMITTGESAFLAKEEIKRISQNNRPKHIALAVIDNYVGGRLCNIQPDFYLQKKL